MPELIDVHHHIVPKEYVESLAKKGITKALGVQFPAWNVKKALDKLSCQSRLKGSGSIPALLPKTVGAIEQENAMDLFPRLKKS